MATKDIQKTWYTNGGAGYTINQVNYADNCLAQEDDTFYISFPDPAHPDSVKFLYKGTNADNLAFWNDNAKAEYKGAIGVILGSSTINPKDPKQTRQFSIALDRSMFAAAFRIHVYVGGRGAQPDDGSWTGNGR